MDKRPCILQIISGFAVEGPLGGIERFGMALAKAIDPEEFRIILCGLWSYDVPFEYEWVEYMQEAGVEAFIATTWNENSPYLSFRKALSRIKNKVGSVDIIHSHCQFGDMAAIFLQHTLSPHKIMRTVHNEREWPKRPERRLLLTNILYPLSFDRELGVSKQIKNNLRKRPLAKLLNKSALCIHNAIDIQRFKQLNVEVSAQTCLQVDETNAQFLIGSIGRLTEQKGYSILLKAVPIVLQQLPGTRFVIVGDGYLMEALQTQAQDLGIAENIKFAGAQKNIEKMIQCFDIFVSSSLWEGLPTVLLESMAAQIPIIATDVSGTRELIIPQETGVLVPPNDSIALAEGIIFLLTSSAEFKKNIVTNAYQFVQNFTIEQIAVQYTEVYRQLLNNNP